MGEGEGAVGEACVVCCCVDPAWPAEVREESSLLDPAEEEVVAALLSSRETLLGSPVVMALSSSVLSEGGGLLGSSVASSSMGLPGGRGLSGSLVSLLPGNKMWVPFSGSPKISIF